MSAIPVYLEDSFVAATSKGFVDKFENVVVVQRPEDAEVVLVAGEDSSLFTLASAFSQQRVIAIIEPHMLTRVLMMQPAVIHRFLFSPPNPKALHALITDSLQDKSVIEDAGSLHRAESQARAGNIILFQRDPEHPSLFQAAKGGHPNLDASQIPNNEMLYQGYSLPWQNGHLVPLEFGAGSLAYSKERGLTKPQLYFASGQLSAEDGPVDAQTTSFEELSAYGYVPPQVYQFLLQKEAIRSNRFKRPFTVLSVYLPYEEKFVKAASDDILDLLRKSDFVCEPSGQKLEAICAETDYFDAFWLVHRIQEKLQSTLFSDTILFGKAEKPSFSFWTHPDTHTNQPDSVNYPKALKDLLFPARREFWDVFESLMERFSGYLEPIDATGDNILDFVAWEASAARDLDNVSAHLFLHLGNITEKLSSFMPILRHRNLRGMVEVSGFFEGENLSPGMHSIPFQSISDPRTENLLFYAYRSQTHSVLTGRYTDKKTGKSQGFYSDDPWIIDLFTASFNHTYFLNRTS